MNLWSVGTGCCAGELLYTFFNDGVHKITDAEMDQYFKEGSAKAGIEAILNAGKFYVNNFRIPADEDAGIRFKVNGFVSLWKEEAGWACSVHKDSWSGLDFNQCRMIFIENLSRMAGLTVELYCNDRSGHATGIATMIKESVLVAQLTASHGTVAINRSEFTLTKKPGMVDVNTVAFPLCNADPTLNPGDMALYWEATDGWHLQRAEHRCGILHDGKDHSFYLFDNATYKDSGVSKYCLAPSNRPGQYILAHKNLKLTSIPVNMWLTDTGYPFGFTSGENAEKVLALAIENTEAALARVSSSVKASDLEGITAALTHAKAALNTSTTPDFILDRSVYELDRAMASAGLTVD